MPFFFFAPKQKYNSKDITFSQPKFLKNNNANRYAQNRYQQNEKLFGDTFNLTHHGFARAIWSIHVLYGIDELSEELFGKVHDGELIIMTG